MNSMGGRMKTFLRVTLLFSFPILAWGTVASAGGTCLREHYPDFKGNQAVWGYMPSTLEQEAICRSEFAGPEFQQARSEVTGDDKSPVTLELRKLWLMDRVQRESGDKNRVSLFRPLIVRNPPRAYLEIRPGVKPEQVPHLDMKAKRDRVPDLTRTLDVARGGKIYYFRRGDESLPAVCIEPAEDGSCREILTKEQYESRYGKKPGEEEKGFKGFMNKVKKPFTGPPPKEISEGKNVDFHGVRLTDVAYAFDYEFAYIGFFARIASRPPFVVKEEPQYIRDVFGLLIKQFGEPAFKAKSPVAGPAGGSASHAVWITEDGFRIDALCENPADDSGICRNGRLSVRRLAQLRSLRSTEGAEFFE